MNLAWAVDVVGTRGPAQGYRTLHRELKAALEAIGATWDADASLVLHVTPPHLYVPLEGRRNAVFTMVETDQLDPRLVAGLRSADVILVPSRHNATVLRWAGCRQSIRVIPLGCGAAHLETPVPVRSARPFRFLWVGQASVRKGWDIVNDAWRLAFPPQADMELVLKTIPTGADDFETAVGRVRVIARAYTDAEMAALYRQAHVFVFPSRGEGFGLPALEAMAAGCLVVAPRHTGLEDFFDARVGVVLPWRRTSADYGVSVTVPSVLPSSLALAMRHSVVAYATTFGVRTKSRARAMTYTWTRTAQGVLDALASMEAEQTVNVA